MLDEVHVVTFVKQRLNIVDEVHVVTFVKQRLNMVSEGSNIGYKYIHT